MNEPQNRLDRALWALEQTLHKRALQALGRVQEAIAQRRARGQFDEFPIYEKVMTMEQFSYNVIERELDLLAERVLQTGPL